MVLKTAEDVVLAFRKHVPREITNLPEGEERRRRLKDYFTNWYEDVKRKR